MVVISLNTRRKQTNRTNFKNNTNQAAYA